MKQIKNSVRGGLIPDVVSLPSKKTICALLNGQNTIDSKYPSIGAQSFSCTDFAV